MARPRRRAAARSPLSSVPAAFAAAPGSHSAARPLPGTARSAPQPGTNDEHDVVAAGEAVDAGPRPRRPRRPPRGRAPSASRAGASRRSPRGRSGRARRRGRGRAARPGPGRSSSSSAISSGRDVRVRRRQAHLAQHGAADLHASSTTSRSSAARSGAGSSTGRRGLAVDEHVHEPALAAGSAAPVAEQPDLVAHARAAELADAQPRLDDLRERDRARGTRSATRRRARSPRRAWMSSPPSPISHALMTVSKNA